VGSIGGRTQMIAFRFYGYQRHSAPACPKCRSSSDAL